MTSGSALLEVPEGAAWAAGKGTGRRLHSRPESGGLGDVSTQATVAVALV